MTSRDRFAPNAESSIEQRIRSRLPSIAKHRWALTAYEFWWRDRKRLETADRFSFRQANDDSEKLRRRRVADTLLFGELTRLAQIDTANAQQFQKAVHFEIEREWDWYCHPQVPTRQKSLQERTLAQLRALARHASNLEMASLNLNAEATEAIRETLSEWSQQPTADATSLLPSRYAKDSSVYSKIASTLRALSEDSLRFAEGRSKRQRGRPYNDNKGVGNGSLELFTLRLLWDVRSAGGKLTLDKNLGSGSLVDALTLLRPYLPARLIPISLPFSTLAGIKSLDNKLSLASEVFWSSPNGPA